MSCGRRTVLGIGAALLTVVLLAVTVWAGLFRERPQSHLAGADAETWFKYGSIGSEADQGIPYWIWLVLPRVFPDLLPGPGGYAAFGFVWEPGEELPVGFSKKTIGFARVAFNCAFCHTARYRLHPGAPPRIVAAGPGHTVRAQDYARFLARAAGDARFNADVLMAAIERIHALSWPERLLYRHVVIPATRKALVKSGWRLAWSETRPDWGPGRIDPFNPIKFGILGLGIDATTGNADMVPIWNMQARAGHALHWDGLQSDFHEVVISSAIGDGMTYDTIPAENLDRIERWLATVPPPASPFGPERPPPYRLDPDQVATGRRVFTAHCGECHAPDGSRTGTVIPVAEVGTDRARADMWTAEAAARYNAYAPQHDWKLRHFRDVDGYVAVLLDGLWLRGPYLHNGSVPSVRALLEPPQRRPQVFYRGHDLIDPVGLGFVSRGAWVEHHGFRYDTTLPGNGNQGHLYGTGLPEADKAALLTYLKTL